MKHYKFERKFNQYQSLSKAKKIKRENDTKAIPGIPGAGCTGGSMTLFVVSWKNKSRVNDVTTSMKSGNAMLRFFEVTAGKNKLPGFIA